jgi:hypothetical protein
MGVIEAGVATQGGCIRPSNRFDRAHLIGQNRGMDNEAESKETTPSATPAATDASVSAPPDAPTPETLKSAYNVFKKRWKLTRLDYDSRIGRSPLSGGQRSAIVGIAGPREYPKAVWEELVKQGRLKHAGSGLYSMP